MLRKVFLVSSASPTRKIREVEVALITRKFCWAEEANGRRHLVGSTAFFTLVAAERAKLGYLTKMLGSPGPWLHWSTYEKAKLQVLQLRPSLTVH